MALEFMDLFTDEQEYPTDNQKVNGIPEGQLFLYVSNTYLNAFINCIKPIKMYVAGRYYPEHSAIGRVVKYQDPPHSFQWKELPLTATKRDIINLFSEPGRVCHLDLTDLMDDVLILGKYTDDEDVEQYMFFWYDRDVSDCCVGRIRRDIDVTESQLIEMFTEYVTKRHHPGTEYHPSIELSNNCWQGWVTG